MESYYNLS